MENWAIIISAGRKYLGNCTNVTGNVVLVDRCLEYYSDPIQAQTPQGQVVLVGKTRNVGAFDHTLDPVKVTMRFDAICYFKDMSPRDRSSYESMVEDVCRKIESERVKRDTGIVIADKLPNGGNDAFGRPQKG